VGRGILIGGGAVVVCDSGPRVKSMHVTNKMGLETECRKLLRSKGQERINDVINNI
jgi:hypothetical protein